MKGIKREFSVARTPQQNGVAERKNRTLIEAARTMLANSKLPTTFWAELVNTACYVQNRVLVIKPHNKTPYELFLGRKPALSFMRPFRCPVIILNTIDHLGTKACDDADSKNSPDAGFKPSREEEKKNAEDPGNEDSKVTSTIEPRVNQENDANVNSTNNIKTVSPTINATGIVDNVVAENIVYGCVDDPNMPELDGISRFSDVKDNILGADMNNLDTYFQMDVKSAFLYGKIEEEVYVCQPPGFEDPDFPDKVYKVEKALYGLHQAPKAWYEKSLDKSDIMLVQVYVDYIIFGSTKKKMCTKFEKMMHKKFQISSMGELTFFVGLQVKQKEDGIFISQDKYVNEILNKFGFNNVKTVRTPMETQKALLKDADGEDVDKHLYRSMIGSLMYLTSSRPNIMFATKIHIGNESTICIVKNPVFHSKTKHIEIRHHFIRDSNEKKLIQMIKIHTYQNVADLLTKAFDVSRFQYLIANGNAFWNEIGVNVGDSKLMLLGITYYCWATTGSVNAVWLNLVLLVQVNVVEDFLNAHPIKYALTVNPTIYTACIEQFWATTKVKTVNGEVHIQALVDKKNVIITKTSVRSDLQLEDAEGTECLPNATIFEQLTLIGAKTNAWNEFSSTIASAVIYLATNQNFNFSKYVFDNMVKNLEGGFKFLMYPRQGKHFSGRDTPLFPCMIVQAQEQSRRKQRKDTKDPQLSGLTEPVTNDTENVASVPIHSNDPLLSGEDRLKLNELIELCTSLSQRVFDVEKTKTSQAAETTELKERVKRLEKKVGSRTYKLRRLYKIGRSARVVSSEDEGLGDQEDASKQGWKIDEIDQDAEVTLVDETQGRYGDNLMFDTGFLDNEQDMAEKEVDMAEKDVSIADPVTTASEVVTTANVTVSTAKVTTDSTTTTTVDPNLRYIL
ncbi:uncharacterized mitochondrial protein-like protein [Tanacetum coccineum]|uniref:Uncharacterized mitochondrial protein-like protein n=1 Tax=Tanacetum coccineum TaxID=301880 RepID=A0ABQ5ACC0_9ASTR